MEPKRAHYGLARAEEYQAPDRNLMQRALRTFIPNYADRQDFQEARDYAANVHANPTDSYNRVGQRQPDSHIYATSFRHQLEENDKSVYDEYSQRALHQNLEDPYDFRFRNRQELDDMSTIHQFVKGSRAGLYNVENQGSRGHSIDPYNVASWSSEKAGGLKGLLGMRDYRGSVKPNPGLNPYADTSGFKAQVDDLRGRVF